jgi:hypothetical protein
MSLLFNVEAEIQRQRRERVKDTEQRLVIIGNGITGDPYADDNHLWVRDIGSKAESGYSGAGLAYRVLAGIGPTPEIDKHVWVEWQPGPREYQVKISDPAFMQQTGRSMHLENPSDPHNQFITTSRFVTLLSKPVGSGKVNVQGYAYLYDGVYREYKGTSKVAGTHVDILSFAPATAGHRCYVVLAYNYELFAAGSNPIQTFVSTSQSTDLDRTDIQECIAQMDLAVSRPIWAYRVDNGWTAADVVGTPDDRDLRFWLNEPYANPNPIAITSSDLSVGVTESPVGTFDLSVSTSGAPFVDTTAIVKGSADATKLLRFEVDGFTTSTTRVMTPPNYDGTLATLAGAETLANKTLTTPTIPNLTNAQHTHMNPANGGQLTDAALSAPVGVAKGGSGADMSATGGANFLLKQTSVGGAFTAALMVLADIPNLLITGAKIALATIGLTNLANGTPFRYMGWDSTGAASELDGALDVTGATGESWTIRDDLYLDEASNTWFKVDIDAVPAKIGAIRGTALAAATHPSSGNRIRREGIVTGYTGLTAGGKLYASPTAGGYTQTKPSVTTGSGQVVVCEIGYAISTTSAFIDKDRPIEYLKRDFLLVGGTLAITHHSDSQGRTRTPDAYLASNTEDVKATYASSNQDAAIALKRIPTGSTVTVDAAGVTESAVGDVGGTDFRLAQQFTPAVSGYLTSITFRTGVTVGSPTVFPSYGVYTNNAISTIPTNTALTGSTGTLAAWSSSSTITISYTGGPWLTAGTSYWFVLQLSAMQASGVTYMVLRNTAGAYASGVMKWDTTTGASFPGTWANGAGTNDMRMTVTTAVIFDRLAQGVAVGSTDEFTRVQLYLKRTGTLTGDLTAYLYFNDGGGNPLTAVATSEVVAASSVGTSYGYVTFSFATPVSVLGDTAPFIALGTTDVYSASNYIEWGVDTSSPSYTGGQMLTLSNSSWAAASPAADGCFILYGVGTYFDQPVDVGLGSPVIEAHYGDGSYASQDTITTFENVYNVLINATVRVRM